MQTLNVNYDYQVGDIGETSTLPKRGNIIQNSMRKKMGKMELLWFE